MNQNTKTQTESPRIKAKIENMKKRLAQQKRWDDQRASAESMPLEDLLEKARSFKQLTPAEGNRLQVELVNLEAKLKITQGKNEKLLGCVKHAIETYRNHERLANQLGCVAHLRDDKVGCDVSAVTWGRAANLLTAFVNSH